MHLKTERKVYMKRVFKGLRILCERGISYLYTIGIVQRQAELPDVKEFVRHGVGKDMTMVTITKDPDTMAESKFEAVRICKSKYGKGVFWALSKKGTDKYQIHFCQAMDGRVISVTKFGAPPWEVHKSFGSKL